MQTQPWPPNFYLMIHEVGDPTVEEDCRANGRLNSRVVQAGVTENGSRLRGRWRVGIVVVVFRKQGGRRRRVLQPEVPVSKARVDVSALRATWCKRKYIIVNSFPVSTTLVSKVPYEGVLP